MCAHSCLTLCSLMDCTCQTLLSLEFSRQEYWSLLPFPPPGYLPDPGIEPESPALAGRFFTTLPPGKPILLKQDHKSLFAMWMITKIQTTFIWLIGWADVYRDFPHLIILFFTLINVLRKSFPHFMSCDLDLFQFEYYVVPSPQRGNKSPLSIDDHGTDNVDSF